MMNVWIVYESRLGNTARLAAAMAQAMAQSDRVQLLAASQAGVPSGVQLLLVGIPGHRSSRPDRVLAWLRQLPAGALKGVWISVFEIRFSRPRWFEFSMGWKISRMLLHHGAKHASSPECFFLSGHEGPMAEGEVQRACTWATQMLHTLGPVHRQPKS
jgi:hypothetical protein